MQFVELAFTVPEASEEAWAQLLVEAGAAGVEARDAETIQLAPRGQATLIVWVEPGEAERFLERVRSEAGALPEPVVARRDRDEDEWRDAWKRHFGARRVGRFVIVPSWVAHAPAPGEVAIDLDPGRAFGTGGHPSTRLCLQALDALAPAGRFLDVGCGSGLLSIACALAWPKATGVGVDVDPDAIEVSRENAARNGVGERIAFSTTPAGGLEGAFEVVTANIEPQVLIPLAPALAARLAPGGRLILSGILIEAADEVEAAYRPLGLSAVARLDEEGWRALVLGRGAGGG